MNIRSEVRVWLVVAAVSLGSSAGIFAAASPMSAGVTALFFLLVLPAVAAALSGQRIEPLDVLWPFLLCYGITYGVKPVLDAQGGRTYDWFEFDASSAVRAVAVASVALLFVYGGYFSGAYRAFVALTPDVRRDPPLWRARLVALVLTGCGGLTLITLYRTIPDFTIGRAVAGALRVPALRAAYGHGYLLLLSTVAAFAPALQMGVALTTRRASDRMLAAAVMLVVLTLLVVLYSRQLILQTSVMLIVVLYFRGRLLTRGTVLAAGLLILLIGGFLGLRVRAAHVGPMQAFAFLGHTFDSFEFLAPALDRVSPLGHFGGLSFVEDAVLTYVPRAWFPEKPDVFGIVRVQDFVQPKFAAWSVSSATFPPGFLVEGLANFGWAGIALIAAAYGVALRLAQEWFVPRRQMLFPLLVYGGLVLNMTGLFRSAAQTALQLVLFTVGLYVLLYGSVPVRPKIREHVVS